MDWMIVDPDIFFCSKLLNIFENSAFWNITHVFHDGLQALEYMFTGRVQGMIVDLVLPGVDGLTLLEAARRVDVVSSAVITSFYQEDRLAQACELGASICLSKSIDREGLEAAFFEARPAFEKQSVRRVRHHAGMWLDYLGMPRRNLGHRYLCEAVAFSYGYPTEASTPQRRLYPALAQHFGCAESCIERNIRTAVETLWLRGESEKLYRFLGDSVAPDRGKPTNRQMLAALIREAVYLPPVPELWQHHSELVPKDYEPVPFVIRRL